MLFRGIEKALQAKCLIHTMFMPGENSFFLTEVKSGKHVLAVGRRSIMGCLGATSKDCAGLTFPLSRNLKDMRVRANETSDEIPIAIDGDFEALFKADTVVSYKFENHLYTATFQPSLQPGSDAISAPGKSFANALITLTEKLELDLIADANTDPPHGE